MGIYEWVLLGVMFAVVIVPFAVVFALEAHKTKKLRPKITEEILCVRMFFRIKVFSVAAGVISLFGTTFVIIYCSLTISVPPKEIFALFMFLIAFLSLLCAALYLGARYNFVAATDDGLWVYRILLKPKFYKYDEFSLVKDTTGFGWAGGYIVYRNCNGKRKRAFSLSVLRDNGVKDMIAYLKTHSPRLIKINALFRY